MKKALLISLMVTGAVAGGGFAYGWHSVAHGPSLAATEPSIPQPRADIPREDGQVILTLDEPQLNQLVNNAISSQPQTAQILTHARSLHTSLRSDLIETGAVLNLSELPPEALPANLQASLNQLTSAVPMLANRDIYIGIVGRPQVENGQIRLDQDIQLKLGQMTLPLADVAAQMGLSISDVEQRLNAILNQQGLTLNAIDIVDGKLIISGERK